MKIELYRGKRKPRGYWLKELTRFMDAQPTVWSVQIEPPGSYKDIHSLQRTIIKSLHRYHICGVRTWTDTDHVYLSMKEDYKDVK